MKRSRNWRRRTRRPPELVRLRFFVGLKNEEAAEVLNISERNGQTALGLRAGMALRRAAAGAWQRTLNWTGPLFRPDYA
jgi:DNA-directed RNA polymerase specialized sigma24 family protein